MPAILITGSFVAAATTGALVAFGRRLGGSGLPFAAISATFLHRTPSTLSSALVVTGLLIHIVGSFLWSGLFLWLVRARAWRVVPAAFAIAVAAHLVSWVTAWTTGNGLSSVLPLGDRLVLAVLLAGALVAGMRIAFPPVQNA